jgi:transposase
MSQITLLSGPERRRRWSDADKVRIVEASLAPGASVAEVARRFDVSTGLIYTWRRQSRGAGDGPAFVEAVVASAPVAETRPSGCLLVELPSGARVSVAPSAPAALVTATLRALR